jgi:hypothetical protein
MGERINNKNIQPDDQEEYDYDINTELEQTEDMIALSDMPQTTLDRFNNLIENDYDWNSIREKYTEEQLLEMKTWLNKQVESDKDRPETYFNSNVDPSKLNKYQRFTYDLIKEFSEKKEQLLLILLGTAGNILNNCSPLFLTKFISQ